MPKFPITFLRNANPSLHSRAFKVKEHPAFFLLFSTLATGESRYEVARPAGDGETGTWKHSVLCDISMGALDQKQKKPRRLKAGKIDRVKQDSRGTEESLHVEISTGKAKTKARGRSKASENAKENAAAEELNHAVPGEWVSEVTEAWVINTEKPFTKIGVVHAENAASKKAEDTAPHVKVNADIHKEFSKLAAKLELHTYRCGRQWEETACELLDYGISLLHVISMLRRCKTLPCGRLWVGTTLQHFARLGMSHEEMGRAIVSWPTILNISDTVLQWKVEYFESVGICGPLLGKMICTSPLAIVNSVAVLKLHFAFWEDYLQDEEVNVPILISKNSCLLTYNLEKTVKQKLAYLEGLGFQKRVLIRHPSLLGVSVEAFKEKAKLLEQFGLSNTREPGHAHARLYRISVSSLQARFTNLISLGFSPDQVRTMVLQSPQILGLTMEHFHVKLHYALHVMSLSLDALARTPMYFACSLEKRIKYRYEVIQKLQTQGALRTEVSLGYMLGITNADFERKFSEKLHDCGKCPGVPSV